MREKTITFPPSSSSLSGAMKHFNGPERRGKAADEQSAKKRQAHEKSHSQKKDWQAAKAVKQPKQTKREEPSGNSLPPPLPPPLETTTQIFPMAPRGGKRQTKWRRGIFLFFRWIIRWTGERRTGVGGGGPPAIIYCALRCPSEEKGEDFFILFFLHLLFSGKMTDVYFLSPVGGGGGVPPPAIVCRGKRESLLVRSSGQPTPHT